MKIDKYLIRGGQHPNYCEDALFQAKLSEKWFIGAVMDGCSSGRESYFASTLFSKLLARSARSLPYLDKVQPKMGLENLTPEILGEIILHQVFEGVKNIGKELALEYVELLSTLILLVFDLESKEAWINSSGDGFVSINNKHEEIDQNNIPDYMAYHMELPFKTWMANHTKTILQNNVENVIISTDGISKFVNQNKKSKPGIDTAKFLLDDLSDQKKRLNLDEKIRILVEKKNLIPTDDIAILSVRLNQ